MYIAVDVGGTNIRVAGSHSLVYLDFVAPPQRFKNSQDYQADIDFIVEAARSRADGGVINALGICVPGTLSHDMGTIVFAQNLARWEGQPFAVTLAKALGCKVCVGHDGVAAGMGEAYYGSNHPQFYYLIWGTGIGGSGVRRSQDYGVDSEEINWRDIFSSWESDCGGYAIAHMYGKSTHDFSSAEWGEVRGKFANHLRKFVEQTGARNIVFGGGLAVRHREYLESLAIDQLESIRVTKFGDNAGLYGGFALIRQQLGAQREVSELAQDPQSLLE